MSAADCYHTEATNQQGKGIIVSWELCVSVVLMLSAEDSLSDSVRPVPSSCDYIAVTPLAVRELNP
jgi:hypothetical protein